MMAHAILFDPSIHADMIASFADIHVGCMKTDEMVADYLPPFSQDKVREFWAEKASQVAATPKSRHMIFTEGNGQATGVVMLLVNSTETGSFRGEVQKLIVSPQHRGKKIGKQLMAKVEEVARAQGVTLLVCYPVLEQVKSSEDTRLMDLKLLDTDKDSPADSIYPKWGYHQVNSPCAIHSLLKRHRG